MKVLQSLLRKEFLPRDTGISEIRAESCPVEPLEFAQLQNKQKWQKYDTLKQINILLIHYKVLTGIRL